MHSHDNEQVCIIFGDGFTVENEVGDGTTLNNTECNA